MVDTPIGTNLPNYTLVSGDLGATIYCRVTATNASGSSNAISNVVGPITAAVAPVNTVAPAIADTTPEVTVAVSCTTGTWTGDPTILYSYQWKRGGTNVGTDSSSYTPVVGDIGATLQCVVTATNGAGSASATSNTTGAVAAAPAGGTYTFIGSDTVMGISNITTSGINTTGAELLVVGISSYTGAADDVTVTDSKGNTWTVLTASDGGNSKIRLYYSVPTTVGSAHTINADTPGSSNFYGTLTLAAFSCTGTPVLDLQNGAGDTGTTASAGVGITPSAANALVIFAVASFGAAPTFSTVPSGFTLLTSIDLDGADHVGQGFAYLIQTSAALADPDWTVATGDWAARITSFKT